MALAGREAAMNFAKKFYFAMLNCDFPSKTLEMQDFIRYTANIC